MSINIALEKEQEQRIANDVAAVEYRIEFESEHPPEPEIEVDYATLFALQRELEGLREDVEVDNLSRIKKLVRSIAIDLGIQREFIAQFQEIELEF